MVKEVVSEYQLTTKKFLPGIAWFLVVMVLLFTPGNDLPDVGDWFGRINFDKGIHIGVFTLMGYLFMMPIGKSSFDKKLKIQYFLKIAICISLWGITSEFIQKYFIPGRSFDLIDWTVDSIGGFVAYFYCKRAFAK
jgi:VanZ family protein